jgi:hypothetical protein
MTTTPRDLMAARSTPCIEPGCPNVLIGHARPYEYRCPVHRPAMDAARAALDELRAAAYSPEMPAPGYDAQTRPQAPESADERYWQTVAVRMGHRAQAAMDRADHHAAEAARAILERDRLHALALAVRDILWPPDDPEAEWSPDTLDGLARTMERADYGPPEEGWIEPDPRDLA